MIGGSYAAFQRRGLGNGPSPDTAGSTLARLVARLVVLMLALLAILRFTNADRVFLVVGIMVAYAIGFGTMMWSVLWKKSDK